MNKPLPTKFCPPSPLAVRGATNPDTAANSRFLCGLQLRQTATRTPHGRRDSGLVGTQPRRTDAGNETQTFRKLFSTLLALAILVHPAPASAHVRGCHSRKCDRRISVKRHQHFWLHRFAVQPIAWQRWAHSTSWCESRDRRVARESGFYSYFQWTLQTWHGVGGSGNPETHSYAEQAVRAIRLARAHGTGSWPVCG